MTSTSGSGKRARDPGSRGRRLLVVLDNAEHLLPELADGAVRLLEACDGLVVLATSRERFQVWPERVVSAVSLLFRRPASLYLPGSATPLR